jgi:hypothetical protein
VPASFGSFNRSYAHNTTPAPLGDVVRADGFQSSPSLSLIAEQLTVDLSHVLRASCCILSAEQCVAAADNGTYNFPSPTQVRLCRFERYTLVMGDSPVRQNWPVRFAIRMHATPYVRSEPIVVRLGLTARKADEYASIVNCARIRVRFIRVKGRDVSLLRLFAGMRLWCLLLR